jgi:DNA-directed RNA polymerase subunit RPC12/RpoP
MKADPGFEDTHMADVPPIQCPSCRKKFKSKADLRGKRIRCPFCSESFIVPMEELEELEEVGDEEPAKAPTKTDAAKADADPDAPIPLAADDDEWSKTGDNPYGVTEIDLAPRCPNCAHEMPSADAVVCLNCGYNTLTREWGKTEKLLGVSMSQHTMYLLPGFLCLFCLISCMIDRMIFSTLWPFWIADVNWLQWTDYEGLRMWGTMIGLFCIFGLGRFCYRRFIVKPIPDELKYE